MTERIYIDGVDPRECKYYNDEKGLRCCRLNKSYCASDRNCYYKEWKRTEKQLEGLKGLLTESHKNIEVLTEEIKYLSKEI